MRAAAELDVRTVAVYEPADEASLHVALAGQALAVPSYLDTHRIALGAAAEAGGDSVRVSVVGRGPLPIGSLRARAAAGRLGGSRRPAGAESGPLT